MKLKHRSIRFKFFAAISIIALVFIGILVLLNVFFYQDYYMMTRRSELRDAYGSICTSYASDSSDVAALLDSYESRSAIRLAVVTDNGDVMTSSAMQEGDVGFDFGHMEQKFRSFAVLASVVQNRDWVDLGKNEYRFMTISLRDNDQYLCLIGVLNAEHGEYLIAYMPYAYIEQEFFAESGVSADCRRLCAADLSGVRLCYLASVYAPAYSNGGTGRPNE